jgi:putative transposase
MKGVGSAHYHCISRICGGARLLGEREKEVLRGMLWQVAAFCGVRIQTYALMSNHFHVLVFVPAEAEVADAEILRRYTCLYGTSRAPYQPKPEVLAAILTEGGVDAEAWRKRLVGRMHDVSAFMKTVKQRFSVWYNKTHQRYGTLWADRFKSVLVEAEPRALATVAAYIDLNPLRAGLVEHPAEYRWCGYAEAMGGSERAREGLAAIFLSRAGDWSEIAADYRMVLFGKGALATGHGSKIDRLEALQVLNAGGKVPRAHALRCRVRYFSDGAVLGSSEFVQSWFEAHRDQLSPKRKTGPRPMTGSDWEGLNVYRGLRRDVFE